MAKNGVIGVFSCMLLPLWLSLGFLGCVDPEDVEGGSTGGTSLYVFDAGNTTRVLVYSDVAALFEDPSVEPRRTIFGSQLDQVKNLAWGGMCFDPSRNMLYLVSETGDVLRIDQARTQTGNNIPITEIRSFKLGDGDSDRLSNGKFGQASLDQRDGTLYVTETSSSEARVWLVRGASTLADGSIVNSSECLKVSGDTGGTGVTAQNGQVYAYFDGGRDFTIQSTRYTGPRLRKGTSASFPEMTSLIIDTTTEKVTLLAKYGCLATDTDGNVYLARHLTDAAIQSGNANAILRFTSGSFSRLDERPNATFGPIDNLRVISHAVTKGWLAGALSNGDAGTNTLWLWKSPLSSSSRSSTSMTLGSGVSIRGLALDGAN